MDKNLRVLGGMGVGAGLMYLFDPDRGARRRSLAHDKVVSYVHRSGEAIGKTSRDLTNRTRGVVASARSRFHSEEPVDQALEGRVRAKLGRFVSHPHAIDVRAEAGRVTLAGPILADEVSGLLRAVSKVPGVLEVDDQLELHEDADAMPALQGGVRRPGETFELRQEHWSPAARLLVGAAGGGLAVFGARRRDALGATLSGLGLAMLARGITNLETKRLIGTGGGRRAVDLQKTIGVAAPVERVFDLWSRYENFPLFMSHVREVRDLGDGRSHWIVDGPAGKTIEWDAVITSTVPNERIAWKTVEGEPVASAGVVTFEPTEGGGTRVDVRMTYNPPAGALGHVFATLLGADPSRQMDDDLMRMKSFLETGVRPHDAAAREIGAAGQPVPPPEVDVASADDDA
jgi:uncharacterized membrane protein